MVVGLSQKKAFLVSIIMIKISQKDINAHNMPSDSHLAIFLCFVFM